MLKNLTEVMFPVPKLGTLQKTTEDDRQNNLHVRIEHLKYLAGLPVQRAPAPYAQEFDQVLRTLSTFKLRLQARRVEVEGRARREQDPDGLAYAQALEYVDAVLAVAVDFTTLTTNISVTDAQ
jgi:hypothetical protein